MQLRKRFLGKRKVESRGTEKKRAWHVWRWRGRSEWLKRDRRWSGQDPDYAGHIAPGIYSAISEILSGEVIGLTHFKKTTLVDLWRLNWKETKVKREGNELVVGLGDDSENEEKETGLGMFLSYKCTLRSQGSIIFYPSIRLAKIRKFDKVRCSRGYESVLTYCLLRYEVDQIHWNYVVILTFAW